jgi:hypothetical protein
MIQHLIATRDRLRKLCTSLSADHAQGKLSPESWSIAEILEHLALTERRSLIGIKRALSQPESDAETIAQTADKLLIITNRVPIRAGRIPAPESLLPSGSLGIWPGPLEAFELARANTLALAETVDSTFDHRVMAHPALGPLTLRQWFSFTAAHSERHCLQIEERLSLEP